VSNQWIEVNVPATRTSDTLPVIIRALARARAREPGAPWRQPARSSGENVVLPKRLQPDGYTEPALALPIPTPF
jgi:hypothetical protein